MRLEGTPATPAERPPSTPRHGLDRVVAWRMELGHSEGSWPLLWEGLEESPAVALEWLCRLVSKTTLDAVLLEVCRLRHYFRLEVERGVHITVQI